MHRKVALVVGAFVLIGCGQALADEVLFGKLKDGGHVKVVVLKNETGRDALGFEYLDGPITPNGLCFESGPAAYSLPMRRVVGFLASALDASLIPVMAYLVGLFEWVLNR